MIRGERARAGGETRRPSLFLLGRTGRVSCRVFGSYTEAVTNDPRKGLTMRPPVRVGAVNYLNTKPLIHNLEALAPQAELSLDLPSRLADQLATGQLDVALI